MARLCIDPILFVVIVRLLICFYKYQIRISHYYAFFKNCANMVIISKSQRKYAV